MLLSNVNAVVSPDVMRYIYSCNLTIEFGCYNEFKIGLKSGLLQKVNRIIILLGKQAKQISPFIILIGKSNK